MQVADQQRRRKSGHANLAGTIYRLLVFSPRDILAVTMCCSVCSVRYIVCITVSNRVITIQLEEEEHGDRWSSDFTAQCWYQSLSTLIDAD